ncbi:MAG: hypothetical protein ACTSU5_09470 [Promethearchaeota archaeon]
MHRFSKKREKTRVKQVTILTVLAAALIWSVFIPALPERTANVTGIPEGTSSQELGAATSGPTSVTGSATNVNLDGTATAQNTGSVGTGTWSGSANSYYATDTARMGIPPWPGDWYIQKADLSISNLKDQADLLQWPTANTWDTLDTNYEELAASSYEGAGYHQNLFGPSRSFETDSSGWYTQNGGSMARSSNYAKFGSYSLRVTPDGVSQYSGVYSDITMTPLKPDTVYIFSVYVYIPVGQTLTGTWELHRHAYDPNTGCCHHYKNLGGDYQWNDATTKGVWLRKYITIKTFSAATDPNPYARLYIIGMTSTTSGTVYVDGFQIDERDHATEFVDGHNSIDAVGAGTYTDFYLNPKKTTTQQLFSDSDFNNPQTGAWQSLGGDTNQWTDTTPTTRSYTSQYAPTQWHDTDSDQCLSLTTEDSSTSDATDNPASPEGGGLYGGITQAEVDDDGWNTPYYLDDPSSYASYGGWHLELHHEVDVYAYTATHGTMGSCTKDAYGTASGDIKRTAEIGQYVYRSFRTNYVVEAHLKAQVNLRGYTSQTFNHDGGSGSHTSNFGGKFRVEGYFVLYYPSGSTETSPTYSTQLDNVYGSGTHTSTQTSTLTMGGSSGWDIKNYLNTYSGSDTDWRVKIHLNIILDDYAYGYSHVTSNTAAYARLEQYRRADVTVDWATWNVKESIPYAQDDTTGAIAQGPTRDNRERQLSTTTLPLVKMDYYMDAGLSDTTHKMDGIFPALFLKRHGQANWERIIYNSSYHLQQLRTLGMSGTTYIEFSSADRDWFNTNHVGQYDIGLGLYVPSGTGTALIVYLGTNNYRVRLSNVEIQTRGDPCPGTINLRWEDSGTSRVNVAPAQGCSPDGTGSATIYNNPNYFTNKTSGSNHYVDFTFRSETLATFDWTITMTVAITDKPLPVTYSVNNGSTVSFTISSVPVTAPIAGAYYTTNYRSTAEVNVTIPRYLDSEISGECYWNMTNFRVNDMSGWLEGWEITGPSDPSYQTWKDTRVGVYENASTTHQELLMAPGLWGSETSWAFSFNFWAPNDMDRVGLSRDSGFATDDDAFIAQDHAYSNGTFRTTHDEFGEMNVTAEWFNSSGSFLHAAYTNVMTDYAQFNGGKEWVCDGLHGQGGGFVATVFTNKTLANSEHFGIYRVGFKNREFSLTKPTQVSLSVTPQIFDPNGKFSSNSTPITIQVHWQDISDPGNPVEIAYDDGIMDPEQPSNPLPLQARIVISEWKLTGTTPPRKYADAYIKNGWKGWGIGYPDTIVGTEMIGETWRRSAKGYFEVDVSPISVYNTAGNMSQGYHNFTIELRREGFENQTVTGDFNIMIDTFLYIQDPAHLDTSPNTPHSQDDKYEARKNITIEARIKTRTTGTQTDLSNATDSVVAGRVHLNYTLTKIGHIDQTDDQGAVNGGELYWAYSGPFTGSWSPQANWSLVNLTWCSSDPWGSRNYHNGSLTTKAQDQQYIYQMRVQLPGYSGNSAGYGDNVGPGNPAWDADDGSGMGVQKYLYYNFSYWIEVNTTLQPFEDGTVDNSFQPNIYTSASAYDQNGQYFNGTCERPQHFGNSGFDGNPDYSGVYDSDSPPFEGRKVEEWARVLLQHESTGNVTNLVIINASQYIDSENYGIKPHWSDTNMGDSGWAFNMTQVWHEGEIVHAVFDDFLDESGYDPSNPPEPYYQAVQYWKNLTQYAEVNPGTPQLIRFRVLYNCTWSEFYATWMNNGTGATGPLCGPLPAASTWEFDGAASLILRNWNDTQNIPLDVDPSHPYSMQVRNYSYNPLYPDTEFVTVTGDTWVTPWLNITEHAAEFLSGGSGQPDALEIVAKKNGFYESSLEIKLDILPQKTTLRNATSGNTSLIVDENGNQVGSDFLLTTPWGNPISFQVNYTDVTNQGEGKYDPIDGATIQIPEWSDDDTPGSVFYYDNGGTEYWTYNYTGSGIYNITLLKTDFESEMQEPKTFHLTFELSKQNYVARRFNLNITISMRTLMVNILNSSVLRGLYADPSKYYQGSMENLDNPLYQEINFTFEILDVDANYAPVNLTDYLSGSDTIDKFFDFGSVVTSTIIQNNSIAGHPRYELAVYTGVDVGWHVLTFGIKGVPKYFDMNNNSYSFEVLPVWTQLYMYDTSVPTFYYVEPDEPWDEQLHPSFTFEVIDVNHTNRWGHVFKDNDSISDITSSHISLPPTWTNQWDIQMTFHENYMTEGLIWWKRVYKVTLNITGLAAGDTMWNVPFTIDKPNHQQVAGTFQFYIKPTPTEFYNLKLNNQPIYNDGSVYYDADPIVFPWNQSISLQVGWGSKDIKGIQHPLLNESDAPISLTLDGWNPVYNDSWQQVGSEASYGKFSVNLATDMDLASLPYEVTFNLTMSKANYATKEYQFHIQIRARKTTLRVMENIAAGIETWNLNWEISYGERMSFGFELVDAEENSSLITEAVVKSLVDYGTTKMEVDGHPSGQDFTWTQEDLELRASLTKVAEGEHFYYNFTFLDTNELNVLRDPDNPGEYLPHNLTFTIELKNYLAHTIEIHLTVLPKTVSGSVSADIKLEDTFINIDEVSKFTLYVTLINPDTDLPFTADLFDVSYQFHSFNLTNGAWEPIGFIGSNGSLTWDPVNQRYYVDVNINEAMNGVFKVIFTVTSKSGNYESFTLSQKIVFQNPPPGISRASYLIIGISILLMASVGGFVTRRLWLMRIPFVLRMIDETVEKIKKDKFPPVGVMTGRREYVVNRIIDELSLIGVKWEMAKKSVEEGEGEAAGTEKELPPMGVNDINKRLDEIPGLSTEEKMLFVEELARMGRKEQEEFLESLMPESAKKPKPDSNA